MPSDAVIEAAILDRVTAVGPAKSICPSEVARALVEDWRTAMHQVRAAAARLAESGRIDILRKGRPVPSAEMRGVIRLRLRAGDEGASPCAA